MPSYHATKQAPRFTAAGLVLFALAASGCGAWTHRQNALGVEQYQQGQYQAALKHFQEAVAANPNIAESYYNLGATYHRMGNVDHSQPELAQAERYYNQSLDHDPAYRPAYRGLAVLLAQTNRTEQAFHLLEDWNGRYPTASAPKVELARLSQEYGKRDQAHEYLLQAVNANPNDAQALSALGQMQEQEGNASQALANYRRSLNLNSMQPDLVARANAIQQQLGPSPLYNVPAPNGNGMQIASPPGATIR
jgi:tetratricopeptide (TPR) repeat protein